MFHCAPKDRNGRDGTLHVVTSVSNPCRYESRYRLYRDFAKYVSESGADLVTVEMAFGERPWEVTKAGDPAAVQLRSRHELWHKENMINLGIQRLPQDWQYVAWIDADVQFARPDWVRETLNQLQHHQVVQMFSKAHDLSPDFEPFQKHTGFVYSYRHRLPGNKDYSNWHPGFAWAARREAIDAVGGLVDFAALGAGDRHMAHSLVGRAYQTMHSKLSENYKRKVTEWQDRAERNLKRDVGYVPGLLIHHWHGKKRDRRYAERWQILVRNQFDPDLDLKRDWQGLWQLTDRNPKLRDDLRGYFRSRNEDSIDLDESESKNV